MTAKKIKQQEEARHLRSQGISIIEIAKQLNVAKSSVSTWVRDIELSTEQIDVLIKHQGISPNGKRVGSTFNRDRAFIQRQKWQDEGRQKAKEGRLFHAKGCMLYWAEGAKRRNTIIFVNSDPNMIIIFARFLRQELHVTNEMINIRVHCHTKDKSEQERIGNYWLNLLGLEKENLGAIQTKIGSHTRKNILVNGICTIEVHSTRLAMHIYGAIQEYCGFERPEWLFYENRQ